ncbi:MAG: hypothetical protein COX02_00460 [Candidatus Vogelbacteria bacterium CG22_combo_CG10-13_8_21_14_all_37_9]|uniref:Uncharacterized protein n=1 Tax=Candidatus Vogelbacteria bacterium CG22_combo_CG10-13_8_21_14_all_37_9 TaxID=1975046 RepID=A0A2H0BL53_9BACT|nr:MAG: hypothetical protein BK005_02155 [bacterium CG10_37_50]PIP58402.1 MAG: hypothetical protein COX02_00460 [Candidatus Vogelbacteria bacterium CG22_combo_CG10-13_8_21_14_all_37_9]
MKRILWRNRASALLGLCVVLVAILNGPPVWLHTTLLVIFGLLIAIFGFARAHINNSETDLSSKS